MNNSKGKFVAKYKTSLLSTGCLSLDSLLNGGLATKTITLLEEDDMNVHCSLLCQHFVLCGLSNGVDTALVNDEFTSEIYVNNLPKIVSITPQKIANDLSELNIAWRYKQMTSKEDGYMSCESNRSNFGATDLSKLSSHLVIKDSLFENLENVLTFVSQFLKEKSGIRRPLRLLISSLGSPLWGCHNGQTDLVNQIYRFLFCLKRLIGNSSITVLVTINPDLFENDRGVSTACIFRSISDYVFKFEAFEDPKSVGERLHNDITGQIRPIKIPSVNSIEPIYRPNTNIWGYHVRRKKMLFKEFSLPPCLSDNTSRTNQNDPSRSIKVSGGCGVDF